VAKRETAKAVEEARRLKPDVVILNITMPVLNGIDAAREIKVKLLALAIVILSSHADKHFIEEATKSGARAYVAKTKAGEALVKAIEAAAGGGDFVLVDWPEADYYSHEEIVVQSPVPGEKSTRLSPRP
jgi:DNA-binding NarL/FixJ family response regulator